MMLKILGIIYIYFVKNVNFIVFFFKKKYL
jgi:hypothetical protein